MADRSPNHHALRTLLVGGASALSSDVGVRRPLAPSRGPRYLLVGGLLASVMGFALGVLTSGFEPLPMVLEVAPGALWGVMGTILRRRHYRKRACAVDGADPSEGGETRVVRTVSRVVPPPSTRPEPGGRRPF